MAAYKMHLCTYVHTYIVISIQEKHLDIPHEMLLMDDFGYFPFLLVSLEITLMYCGDVTTHHIHTVHTQCIYTVHTQYIRTYTQDIHTVRTHSTYTQYTHSTYVHTHSTYIHTVHIAHTVHVLEVV